MLRATLLVLCAVGIFGEAPLTAIPAAVYGPPKEVVDAPYPAKLAPYAPAVKVVEPHTVYGVPETKVLAPVAPVVTKYKFDIPEVVVHKDAPYPAPILKDAPYPAAPVVPIYKPHETYGIPKVDYVKPIVPIVTKYEYDIPKQVVYKTAPYPDYTPVPHHTYGVPTYVPAYKHYEEVKRPIVPIVTKYEYDIPKVIYKTAPYPEFVKPHAVYGVPHYETPKTIVPVVSKYDYTIPKVVVHESRPYPPPVFHVEKPHEVYGVPVETPKLITPLVTKYEYDIPKIQIKTGPYPPVVKPHETYGVPSRYL